MEHVGHIIVTRLMPSPGATDKFTRIYQDVMMDRNVLSDIGPAAIRAVKMMQVTHWRNIIPIPPTFGMWSGNRLIFRRVFGLLPNWGKLGQKVGIPMVNEFEYLWVQSQHLINMRTLASGKFAVVKRGKYHGRDVIVKYIINRKKDYQDVITEAAIAVQMAKLGVGPRVIGLQEADGRTSQLPGIVMEYYPGSMTLADMIDTIGHDNPRSIVKVMASVANKMERMHAHGYIHNDINARNILLIPKENKINEFEVYFSDFGSAMTLEFARNQPLKAPFKLRRNSRFAPEIGHGQQPSEMTDVFSFGHLLNEICKAEDNQTLTRKCVLLAKRCCFEKIALRPTSKNIKDTLWLDATNM